jgi:acyl carrier protein
MPETARILNEQERQDIYDHIRRFLSKELDVPLEDIGPDTTIIDDLKGDSMIYLELFENFKQTHRINVEIAVVGRYLQRNPVRTVREVTDIVCRILEQGESMFKAPDPGVADAPRP